MIQIRLWDNNRLLRLVTVKQVKKARGFIMLKRYHDRALIAFDFLIICMIVIIACAEQL